MEKENNGKTSDNRIKDFRDFIFKCSIRKIYVSYNEQQKEILFYHNPEYGYIASKEALERHHKIDNLRIISGTELRKNTVFKIPANILNINESEIKDICGDSFNGVDCLYIGGDVSIQC